MSFPRSLWRFARGWFVGGVARHRSLVAAGARWRGILFRLRLAGLGWTGRPVVFIALLEHLGDLVAAEPIAREVRLRKDRPIVIWLVRREYRDLVRAFPGVDRVWTLRCLTEWIALRDRRVLPEVLDLHLSGKSCAICHHVLSRNDASSLDTENYYRHGSLLDVFAALSNVTPRDRHPRLRLSTRIVKLVDELDLPPGYVVLHGTSSQSSRNWNVEGWHGLARHLTMTAILMTYFCRLAISTSIAKY